MPSTGTARQAPAWRASPGSKLVAAFVLPPLSSFQVIQLPRQTAVEVHRYLKKVLFLVYLGISTCAGEFAPWVDITETIWNIAFQKLLTCNADVFSQEKSKWIISWGTHGFRTMLVSRRVPITWTFADPTCSIVSSRYSANEVTVIFGEVVWSSLIVRQLRRGEARL